MALEDGIDLLQPEFDAFAASDLTCLYDAKRDVLFIFVIGGSKRRAAVGIDVGAEFWIRQVPSTGKIDDIEIEDFEKVFLSRHPELSPVWQLAKVQDREHREPGKAFLAQIVVLLRQLFLKSCAEETRKSDVVKQDHARQSAKFQR